MTSPDWTQRKNDVGVASLSDRSKPVASERYSLKPEEEEEEEEAAISLGFINKACACLRSDREQSSGMVSPLTYF